MSRSRKKTPKLGFSSSDSEKEDKRMANRSFRHKAKQQVNTGKEPVSDMNEIMTTWAMAKDGKRYVKKVDPKQMRK
jgi:hypothetical protein